MSGRGTGTVSVGPCEERLAQAQATLNSLIAQAKAAEADLTRLYHEYIELLRQMNVSPERLKAEQAVPSGAVAGMTAVADLQESVEGAGPERRTPVVMSSVTALQRRASQLSERVDRLEAKA